ncbi:MAG: inosine/xanthosine triphosphatase [Gemmatimonadaceae bacterium]
MTVPATLALASLTRIAVGSENPVKVGAVRAVFARVAPHATIESRQTESGVRDQPWGDDETMRGALARAKAVLAATAADLGVGVEGGVVETDGGLRTCAWAVVASRDGRIGTGGSLAMELPHGVATLVRSGLELGHAVDRVVGARDTKRGRGAVGVLTAGLVDRQQAYEVIVSYALARFLSAEMWD